MYKWLIIGGGIQGSTLAVHLVKSGKVPIQDLAVIDPHAQPLECWKRNTARIRMNDLRSPSVHHMDTEPFSLQTYADKSQWPEVFFGRYKRPSLSLFNQHCETVLGEIHIDQAWKTGMVTDLRRKNGLWEVRTDASETIIGERVVLAMSFSQQLCWPEWAQPFQNDGIYHVFDRDVQGLKQEGVKAAVVGGGITAAHYAIKLSDDGHDVTMFVRHPFRTYDFDSDPGWLGPKYMKRFSKTPDYQKRRQWITNARHRGSFPMDISRKLAVYREEGRIKVIQDEVISCQKTADGGLQIQLKKNESSYTFEHIALATGFASDISRFEWVQKAAQAEQLPFAGCGFPIVGKDLQWGNGLYVMGAFAELEIGPTARNISGARKAAFTITHTAFKS
ncbi:FAD/NAD(P)-binding protein [Bacillus halotolerans]|uniref:FAD/NAD(P)-binding protein n=1 Tax=Bacillus halotolerans TaxID=260554 RepID=UPI00273CAA5B|nr:FAD/NAD(P)-binding protein [Bacillus halotolerans]MDP4525589.1 FAD/NAD(P)-binding protein [Bacillus halotolerans]